MDFLLPKKVKYNIIVGTGCGKLKKVWEKLISVVPELYKDMHIYIAIEDIPGYYILSRGAWAPTGCICIGQEVLNKFKNNEHVLIAILTHEFSHHILGHTFNYKEESSQEQDADCLGLFLCMQMSYDPIKILKAHKEFENWRKGYLNKGHKKSHGTPEERYELLKKQLLYLGYIEN